MKNQLSENQLQKWRVKLQEMRQDSEWSKEMKLVYHKREENLPATRDLINSYINDSISLKEFQQTFDRNTKKSSDGLGIGGFSGGMFLNQLVKYIQDHDGLNLELRKLLKVPDDAVTAEKKLTIFLDYIDQQISLGCFDKKRFRRSSLSFFTSSIWHLQKIDLWPIYYPNTRMAFQADEIWVPENDIVTDYITFRETYIYLMSELQLDSWDLEYLASWRQKQTPIPPPPPPPDPPIGDDTKTSVVQNDEPSHTHIQWLLATIGKKMGCKVWVASNDQNKEWNGQKLSDLSEKSLPPLGMDQESQKVIRLIDVVWFRANGQVSAAFEIEQTTSIYSGLLRMSDLAALAPNLSFPLYIVAPESRLQKVKSELSRPTFRAIELDKRCGFFSCEKLKTNADNIISWANHPSAIDKLADRITFMDEIE